MKDRILRLMFILSLALLMVAVFLILEGSVITGILFCGAAVCFYLVAEIYNRKTQESVQESEEK